MNLTVRLLGVEVFNVSTDPASLQDDGPGDATAMPMGFTARMERPHESETPDRDW